MVFSSTLARKKQEFGGLLGAEGPRVTRAEAHHASGELDETAEPHQHVGLHEAGDVAEEGFLAGDVGAQPGMLVGADRGVDGAGAST